MNSKSMLQFRGVSKIKGILDTKQNQTDHTSQPFGVIEKIKQGYYYITLVKLSAKA